MAGYVTVFFMVLAFLNFAFKFAHKKWKETMRKKESFYTAYRKAMTFFVKNHKRFGALTIAALVVHFIIQFQNFGFVASGALAAFILILQGFLGGYLSKVGGKNRLVLNVHRFIAVVLLVAVLNHVL
ncbi:MAG TPA: hypothetical protein DHN33_11090 [Eubacteriaceae bacterium]|nr:hypothetical protein [Eubacteriaceae bacterium]